MNDFPSDAQGKTNSPTNKKTKEKRQKTPSLRDRIKNQPPLLISVNPREARALIHPSFRLTTAQSIKVAIYILTLRARLVITSDLYAANKLVPLADRHYGLHGRAQQLSYQRNAITCATLDLIRLLEPGYNHHNQVFIQSISSFLSNSSNLYTEDNRRDTRENFQSITKNLQSVETDPGKKLFYELMYQLVIMYINLIEFQRLSSGSQYSRIIEVSCLTDKITVGIDVVNLGEYLHIMEQLFGYYFTKPANLK